MEMSLQIRNSTVEFLTFVLDGKEDGVQVLYKDDTIWATQKAMSVLFEVDRTVIAKHLKNIFQSGELQIDTVCAKLHILQKMARRTTHSIILFTQLFLLAIESTV